MTTPSPSNDRIAARTLGVGLVLVLAALGLARGFVSLLVSTSAPELRGQYTEGSIRLSEFLEVLPEISRREDAVLVFGSSIIQHGFSPEAFEQRLGAPVTAYNLGFPGVNPLMQALLARKVAQSFEHTGRKARLTLVEFTPFQATLARGKSSWYREQSAVKKALLADPPTLAETARNSPEEASHVGALWLMGGISPLSVTSLLETRIFDEPSPSWWPVPPPEDPSAERKALAARILSTRAAIEHREVPEWDPVRRGEVRWIFDETREAYLAWARLRSAPELLKADVQWRVNTSDMLELRFDDAQVTGFIEAVRTLASVSQETRVVVGPRNRAWNQPTPEGRARLAAVLARIKRETGVPLLDLSESPDFVPEDFIDVTHFNESHGRPKFSRRLAEAVSDQWGPGVAKGAAP
ncbi:SGNH/GDSL hydrolase family protein [Hyalangium versicolor]|uniref:SGNH/GDSL hydrolase family protein n=1 Tax=Hyalangium versicolor TaxID=2861190 RepID=UPI001CCD21AB|nr:SGNH/GDSL hydrolase family protein [Hyalangium versicolor]